jgi:predicted N-acetyltransferase YhbS
MECRQITATTDQMIQLFSTAFRDSEGIEEGHVIGDLVRSLLLDSPHDQVVSFSVGISENEHPVGACIFSKLIFDGDHGDVWLLSPVAVVTAHQGKGVGQAMIRSALESMKHEHGAELVFTYGDPAFYRRVGFQQVSETEVPAPFPLQYPEGWLGQHLHQGRIGQWPGPCRCVSAFNNVELW